MLPTKKRHPLVVLKAQVDHLTGNLPDLENLENLENHAPSNKFPWKLWKRKYILEYIVYVLLIEIYEHVFLSQKTLNSSNLKGFTRNAIELETLKTGNIFAWKPWKTTKKLLKNLENLEIVKNNPADTLCKYYSCRITFMTFMLSNIRALIGWFDFWWATNSWRSRQNILRAGHVEKERSGRGSCQLSPDREVSSRLHFRDACHARHPYWWNPNFSLQICFLWFVSMSSYSWILPFQFIYYSNNCFSSLAGIFVANFNKYFSSNIEFIQFMYHSAV